LPDIRALPVSRFLFLATCSRIKNCNGIAFSHLKLDNRIEYKLKWRKLGVKRGGGDHKFTTIYA
jgi:hypothetical protein